MRAQKHITRVLAICIILIVLCEIQPLAAQTPPNTSFTLASDYCGAGMNQASCSQNTAVLAGASTATLGPSYYLYPHNLHLVAGTTSAAPLTIIDDSENIVLGNVTFHGYDTSLISISGDGYVTALRVEDSSEIGTWVHATINGAPAASTAIVRVLSTELGIPFSRPVGENTVLYYPTNVNGENLSAYVTQHEIPTVNEYAYSIQSQLMGVKPFNGARQIFEVDFGESETQTVCGISGNPIRLGWYINGNEWQNCFLVPFIPPRSPHWNVMYHELGHNFTWASSTFGKGLGRFEYSEGLATAMSAATTQAILNQPTTYPLGTDSTASLQKQFDALNNTMLNRFQDWLNSGADFSELDPDIVDGIWLHYNSQRPDDFAHRFFLPLQPQYASQLTDILDNVDENDQHTVFAALVSAAMGQDLSDTFSGSYHYPIDPALFASVYTAFRRIIRATFPISWIRTSQRPNAARRWAGAAYDTSRRRMVFFGGMNGGVLAETWEYDGTDWYQVHTSHMPPPRIWHRIVYDTSRRVVVLFGGQQDGPRLNDTWEYDGTDWRQINTANSPSPRDGFGMIYDSCRNKVVLFGGETESGFSVETWEYAGSDWIRITTPNSPPGRFLTTMAFDSQRCQTILFGGGAAGNYGLSDTWEYDGNTWSQQSLGRSPKPRWAHAMTFDTVQGKVVLFGGYGTEWPGGQQLGDTWVYDGEAWTQLYPDRSPEAREQHAMAYDSDRNRVVLFGGWIAGYDLNGDTWELQHDSKVFLPLVLSNY